MVVPFVELEFTHNIGPPPGRYVVRPVGEAPAPAPPTATIGPTLPPGSADVLAVRVVAAPPTLRANRARRRVRPADPEGAPAEVAVSVATVLFATRAFADAGDAAAAVAGWEASPPRCWALADEALAVVNRAIRAYRCAAADPYVCEVTAEDPRAVRVGVGGEGVLAGEWDAALLVPDRPSPRLPREVGLRPTELVADVLAGRRRILAGEDVLLRGVLDLEQGRPDAAAAQLAVAVELLAAEGPALAARLTGVRDELSSARGRLGEPPDADAVETLRRLAGRIGEAVDATRAV